MRRYYRHKSRLKRVVRPKWPFRYRKTDALNSNIMSNFKTILEIRSKLHMRREKIAKIGEKQRRAADIPHGVT